MYNTFLHNTTPFNQAETYLKPETPISLVLFNSFSMQSTSVICTNLIDSAPSRDILSGDIPRADGQYVTADYFREKTIVVEGYLVTETAPEMTALMDSMRKNLLEREGELIITRHEDVDTRRVYKATLSNYDTLFAKRKGYDITHVPFSAVFSCMEPFGKAARYTTSTTTTSADPANLDFENIGTIEAMPIISMQFTADDSITAFTVTNTDTGESITYTGALVNTDVLKIDGEAMTIELNDVEVDYSGTFPDLAVGVSTLSFILTGTSYSADITVKFKPRYL